MLARKRFPFVPHYTIFFRARNFRWIHLPGMDQNIIVYMFLKISHPCDITLLNNRRIYSFFFLHFSYFCINAPLIWEECQIFPLISRHPDKPLTKYLYFLDVKIRFFWPVYWPPVSKMRIVHCRRSYIPWESRK